MADTATEIDLDSVIDRLLEGELSSILVPRDLDFRSPDLFSCVRSAWQSSREARTIARI